MFALHAEGLCEAMHHVYVKPGSLPARETVNENVCDFFFFCVCVCVCNRDDKICVSLCIFTCVCVGVCV